MKNIVKSIIYIFIAIIVPGNLVAQDTNESVTLTASAKVLSGLTITKEADVSFGNISATTSDVVRLSPDGSASDFVGSSAVVGKIAIFGSPDNSVLISYPAGIKLEAFDNDPDPNKLGELSFSLHVFGKNEDVQESSSPLSAEGIEGVNVNRTLNGTSGYYYLYVGGSLGGNIGTPAKLSNQPTGDYTGDVVFEVKYN